MALNIQCCSVGYTFVDVNGYFINPITGITQLVGAYNPSFIYNQCFVLQTGAYTLASPGIASIPCACCPPNYGLVNQDGYVSLLAGNVVLAGTFAAGKCISFSNFNITVDAGDCPCCPDGYVYNSIIDECVNILLGAKDLTPTVPCIPCICISIPPPVCSDCIDNQGDRIVLNFNSSIKQCTECSVIGEPIGLGTCADSFIPIQLLDPIINFKRNK